MVSLSRWIGGLVLALSISSPGICSDFFQSSRSESVAQAQRDLDVARFIDDSFADRDAPVTAPLLTERLDFTVGDSLFVVRGQNSTTTVLPSSPYDPPPSGGSTFGQGPVLMTPQPMTQQPMMTPQWPVMPGIDPWAGQAGAAGPTQFGAVGPQPFRYGWQLKFDVGNIFNSGTETNTGTKTGDMNVLEFNGELRYRAPLPNQWVWSLAPQFGYRGWSGPLTPDLPGAVYRTGIDVGLTTPAMGPYTIELGFNPAIGTDFDRKPASNAFMWDGRGAVFIRTAPQWLWVIGAQYWDRVHDQVVPWAGVVFTPDDRWEVRAVFPNPQVSAFLGTPWGVPAWLYLAGEYHVEAYEVNMGKSYDQIELKDWRLVLGLRTEQNGVTSFIEGGWVFDRRARFRTAADINIDDGFIVRGGMRF